MGAVAMRRAPCGMRFKRCLPAALCCNRSLRSLAAIRRHIKIGAEKKLIKEINQKSSARVGAVSCVCEYTETVTSIA